MDDRISALPEDVLHHILSFLSVKEVRRSTILSKAWREAWTTTSILEFDNTFFPDVDRIHISFRSQEEMRKLEELLNVVEQTLGSRQRQSISRLVLRFPKPMSDFKFQYRVNQCLWHAVKGNVKELILEFGCCSWPDSYLPDYVFTANSMTFLSLKYCRVRSPKFTNMKLSLRTLHLEAVHIGDDQFLEDIIDRCPHLEDLNISLCSGMNKIKSPCSNMKSSLKRLTLERIQVDDQLVQNLLDRSPDLEDLCLDWYFERVEFKAPCLQSFESTRGSFNKNTYSYSCENLRKLILRCPITTDQGLFDHLSRFPLLEVFMVYDCDDLKRIKIQGYSIKEVVIWDCNKLVEVEVDCPNLTSFTFHGGHIISFSSSHALALLEANLRLYPENPGTDVCLKVTQLLAKFNHCKVVNLHTHLAKNVIILGKKKMSLPPLYDVEHLTLHIDDQHYVGHRWIKNGHALKLVNSLLWVAPRLKTLSIVTDTKEISLEFMYEKIVNQKESPCYCTSLPIVCWRHCLKEVKIEYYIESGDKVFRKDAEIFFGENAEMLKKIIWFPVGKKNKI